MLDRRLGQRIQPLRRKVLDVGVEVVRQRQLHGVELGVHAALRLVDLLLRRFATRELLALSDRPTCILYPDDFSFIGGMNELERQGISIPEDMSVAGYDGILLSQVLRPRLTTYRQDAEAMGREAAAKLVEAIEQPKTCLPQQIMVSGQLLEGDTVKDIND